MKKWLIIAFLFTLYTSFSQITIPDSIIVKALYNEIDRYALYCSQVQIEVCALKLHNGQYLSYPGTCESNGCSDPAICTDTIGTTAIEPTFRGFIQWKGR